VTDPTTLASLPAATLRAGLAEVVKAAVLASPLVLDALENASSSFEEAPAWLEWMIVQSVRIKAGYVAEDPRDRGLRHALNLGHTFAHALEAASWYELPHGEAVSIGLVAAARLGVEVGSTPSGLPQRLSDLLSRLGLPTETPQGLDPAAILTAMTADKKRRSGRAVFVTPAPGGAELVEDVPPRLAITALLDHAHRDVYR